MVSFRFFLRRTSSISSSLSMAVWLHNHQKRVKQPFFAAVATESEMTHHPSNFKKISLLGILNMDLLKNAT